MQHSLSPLNEFCSLVPKRTLRIIVLFAAQGSLCCLPDALLAEPDEGIDLDWESEVGVVGVLLEYKGADNDAGVDKDGCEAKLGCGCDVKGVVTEEEKGEDGLYFEKALSSKSLEGVGEVLYVEDGNVSCSA